MIHENKSLKFSFRIFQYSSESISQIYSREFLKLISEISKIQGESSSEIISIHSEGSLKFNIGEFSNNLNFQGYPKKSPNFLQDDLLDLSGKRQNSPKRITGESPRFIKEIIQCSSKSISKIYAEDVSRLLSQFHLEKAPRFIQDNLYESQSFMRVKLKGSS